jgi:hypothetical protein
LLPCGRPPWKLQCRANLVVVVSSNLPSEQFNSDGESPNNQTAVT